MTKNKDDFIPTNPEPIIGSEAGKELLDAEEGWVIGVRGNRLLRFPTDKHMVSIASTGGGKGVSIAIPNMLTHEGSVFSIEISGTTYNKSVNFRKNILGQDVHVIDPLGATDAKSAHINLLETLDPTSKRFFSEAKLVAQSLLKSSEGTKETSPYFERTPVGLLLAFLLYVRTSPEVEEENRHLPYVAGLLSKFPTESWHDLMEEFSLDRGPYHQTLNLVGNYFFQKSDENINSIHSTVSYAFDFAQNPQMEEITKDSTFSLSDLRNKKISVYVIMPDIEDYKSLSTWLRLLVERSFAACPNLGDGGVNFAHNDRVLFMLDEFTQLGRLDAVDTGMQTARQKGITIWSLFGDVARLRALYGPETASSLLGAAGVVQVFDVGEEQTLDYTSKRLGKRIIYIPSVQHGENWGKSDQRNWSKTDGITLSKGISESRNYGETESWNDALSEGVSDTVTKNWSNTNSIGENLQTSNENILGFNRRSWKSQPNWVDFLNASGKTYSLSSTRSFSEGTAHTSTRNHTKSVGGSKTQSVGHSENSSESRNEARTDGIGFSQSEGGSYSVQYTPQILPSLDTWEVEDVLGSNNNQILFIRAKNKVMRLIDKRANFYEVPMLRRRAQGPEPLPPPIPYEAVEKPKKLEYQPAVTFNITIPDEEKVEIVNLKFDLKEPLTSNLKAKSPYGGGSSSPREYARARSKTEDSSSLRVGKARAVEQDIFLNAAKAIEAEGLEIAGRIEEIDKAVKNRWNKLGVRAWELSLQRSSLKSAGQQLKDKQEKITEFESILSEYRKALIEDAQGSGRYKSQIDYYEHYLTLIRELRESWPEVEAPQRPQKQISTSENASPEEIMQLINPEIQTCAPFLPSVPSTPENPRDRNSTRIAIAKPASDLSKDGVGMKDGKVRTLSDLDKEIAKKSGSLSFLRRKKGNEPSVDELKQARRDLITHIQHDADQALDNCAQNQRKFQEWLERDNENAKKYAVLLSGQTEKLQDILSRYKAAENQMDLHWQYLERRLEELNQANRIFENSRIEIHNLLADHVEWDNLEAQTTLIESQKPEQKLLSNIKDHRDKEPQRRGEVFDAKLERHIGGFTDDDPEGPGIG